MTNETDIYALTEEIRRLTDLTEQKKRELQAAIQRYGFGKLTAEDMASLSAPAEMTFEARQALALKLRSLGKTYQEIGTVIGVTGNRARQIVTAAERRFSVKARPSPEESVFHSEVDMLDLSIRSANCLRNNGITSINQLKRLTEDDLLRMRNLGQKSLNEIRSVISSLP